MNNDQFSVNTVQCIILAAGQGTRMKSQRPKVLHPIAGQPMVRYAIEVANSIGSLRPSVVVGHGAEDVKQAIGESVSYALQAPQLGTGHAVLCAREQIDPASELVVVLYGDTPLITAETLQHLIDAHVQSDATVSLITFRPLPVRSYVTPMRGEKFLNVTPASAPLNDSSGSWLKTAPV